MSKYTFTVRKNKIEISLTTDDRDAIEQQIAIWVMATNRKHFMENPVPKEYTLPVMDEPMTSDEPTAFEEAGQEQFVPAEENTQEIPDTTECVYTNSETEFTNGSSTQEEPKITPFEPERITAEEITEETRQEYVEEFINNIEPEVAQEPEQTIQVTETPQPQEILTAEDKVELEKRSELAVTLNSLFNAENPETSNFESILEKTVDNIGIDNSSVVKKDENFCKLVKANNITDRLELLLFTADYFCKYDARFVFSLKQINGKLMNNLAVIVDHGILKIALDNNYIERVDDSDYRLTEYGRSEIYSKAGIWS